MSTPNDHSMPDETPRDATPPEDRLPSRPSDTDPSAAEPEDTSDHMGRDVGLATFFGLTVLLVVLVATGYAGTVEDQLAPQSPTIDITPRSVGTSLEEAIAEDDSLSFLVTSLNSHPAVVFRPYFGGSALVSESDGAPSLLEQFRDFIEVYIERQAGDDNFTIRVVDGRNGDVLEVVTLDELREAYEETGEADWLGTIDEARRAETRRLVDKWEERGIPREPILVKWGRATQVAQAQERNRPFIEHEVRLTRFLDLSLLATQISTVETFNNDTWVSSAGARSRYQMMPFLLRQNLIASYPITTTGGNRMTVREEWHPLITMPHAFRIVRGYANAVGHEIPGISAYHTGPGNINRVYREFIQHADDRRVQGSTVMDAYMWAVTEGYEHMSDRTSFGPFSRGYVAATYGSLRAMDDQPVDTSQTMLAERVQLRSGTRITLEEVLDALEERRDGLHHNYPGEEATMYEVFRWLNPHIPLPETRELTPQGNLRIVPISGGDPVRFFLPLGGVRALEAAGHDVVDPQHTFRFAHDAWAPTDAEETEWDREYREIVDAARSFEFTDALRRQLFRLADRFEELADENPTDYRKSQLEVIQMHERLWRSEIFSKTADVVQAHQEVLDAPRPDTSSGGISTAR